MDNATFSFNLGKPYGQWEKQMSKSTKMKDTNSIIAGVDESSESDFERTPMFLAKNFSRYERQRLIQQIENKTGRTLLCYVAGANTLINRDDVIGFNELLHNVSSGDRIDLLIHTLGGDIDSAEKIIKLLHASVGQTESQQDQNDLPLRVVVPDYAKSAGTLIALGANSIVMSDSSELGTIDPQVVLSDKFGNLNRYSVFDYINAYKRYEHRLSESEKLSDRIMFDKFEPHRLIRLENIKKRVRELAENTIKIHGGFYTGIVQKLMDTGTFPSHSQVIDWEVAKLIGLPIDYHKYDNLLWRDYWQLYCMLRTGIADDQKIFESRFVSYIP